jgi:hypothetical protein
MESLRQDKGLKFLGNPKALAAAGFPFGPVVKRRLPLAPRRQL